MTCLSGQQFPLPQPYIQTSPTANASWPATSPPAVGQTTRHATPTQARHADADAWGQCLAWVARVCRAHTILPPLLAYPYSVRASTASTTYSVALTGQGPRCRFCQIVSGPGGGACACPEAGRGQRQANGGSQTRSELLQERDQPAGRVLYSYWDGHGTARARNCTLMKLREHHTRTARAQHETALVIFALYLVVWWCPYECS